MGKGNNRNLKCPCGSEKKYKNCCINKSEEKTVNISGVLRGPLVAGPDDDFYNRFLFQNLEIRCFVVPKNKRAEFDKNYDHLLQNLKEAKFAKELCFKYIEEHKEAIRSGKDGILIGHQLNINNPIDTELNMFFKDFFIRNSIAIEMLQNLLRKSFGYNINFLFTDVEKDFKKGAEKFKLQKDDPRFKNLVNFIKTHRDGWYSDFKNLRNDIEHDGYKLPEIKHNILNGKVNVVIPYYKNHSIEQILNTGWINLTTLCEEILIFIMSLELKTPYVIWKIPEDKRSQFNYMRYKVSIPEYPEAHISHS